MMNEVRRDQVREFLSRFTRVGNLSDSDDIFAQGIVNSLFAMQMVQFVENEFGVVVENEDLDLRNFNSVNAILDFVSRKSPHHSP